MFCQLLLLLIIWFFFYRAPNSEVTFFLYFLVFTLFSKTKHQIDLQLKSSNSRIFFIYSCQFSSLLIIQFICHKVSTCTVILFIFFTVQPLFYILICNLSHKLNNKFIDENIILKPIEFEDWNPKVILFLKKWSLQFIREFLKLFLFWYVI